MTGGRPAEIRALTGLRGIAAVAVMGGHFYDHAALTGTAADIVDATGHSVELFFILSGFVLAMVYGNTIQRRGGFWRYVRQRLARIYPLYAVMTLLCFALASAGVPLYGQPTASGLALLSNLLMTQQWGWPIDSLDAPGWSISTEWAANLLFPLAAWAILRRSARQAITAAVLCGAVLVIADRVAGDSYWDMPILLRWGEIRLPESMITCAAEFLAGMACWRLRPVGLARWLGHDWVLAAIMGGMVLQEALSAPSIWFCTLAALLVIGLSQERSAIARVLGWGPLHWLGVISYSVYLVHAPMMALVGVLSDLPVPHAFTVAIWGTMLAVLPAAAATHRWIERPAQRWLRTTGTARPVFSRPPQPEMQPPLH